MKNTIFWVVLLVLVLGVGYSFATRNNSNLNITDQNLYQASDFDLAFTYPNGYYLKDNKTAGTVELPQLGVVLVSDTPDNRAFVEGSSTTMTEGPTAITMEAFANPKNLSVNDWLLENTNWLANFPQTSTAVTVADTEGKQYLWDGLYPGKSILISKNGHTYIFSVTWLTPNDQILKDFDSILKTVDLK